MTWFRALQGDLEDPATTADIPRDSVDVVVTSPPYKDEDGYTDDLMIAAGKLIARVLRPGGRVFFNFAQLRTDTVRPIRAANALYSGAMRHEGEHLRFGQTIIWVKSLAVDGFTRGHYTPINSKHVLNYGWEFIFTLFKPPEPAFDRLAVGVPFKDKSYTKRGTRGKNGDIHCAGDVWFLPYRTTGKTRKKKHQHEYPVELVDRCLRVHGAREGAIVLDPFMGSGTTAVAAQALGMNAWGVDVNPEAIATQHERTGLPAPVALRRSVRRVRADVRHIL